MIASFPTPYEDELHYSVCARYSDRMQFGHETGAMLALHGSRHRVAIPDLPHRLNEVASELPSGHPCTLEAIIDRHTFLPYYSPFITKENYAKIREYMANGDNPTARITAGACSNRVVPPKLFRSCPLCDRENHENHGETYWRRLFQLPGGAVCPVHKVFLKESNVRLHPLENRHKYVSAESAELSQEISPIDEADPQQRLLLAITKEIAWMMNQKRLNPGLDFVHARYREILKQKGFATKAGSIRMDTLCREIMLRYGGNLLRIFQSELPKDKGDGWLGHLLRKNNTAVAPLRHILLVQALGINLEEFFSSKNSRISESSRPTAGPWLCFNHVCEYYNQKVIQRFESRTTDTNDVFQLVLKCPHCGYTYLLREESEDLTKPSRIIDYGHVFKRVLRKQWADDKLTLRYIAKNLGVDPKTVKQRAAELGLPFPRDGRRPVTKVGLYTSKKPAKEAVLKSKRTEWLQLREEHPDCGTKQLRNTAPALYAWLYRNDRNWLTEYTPTRKAPPVQKSHVNWPERDEEFAGKVSVAVLKIRNAPGKPQRITRSAIAKILGKQSLLQRGLAKLHMTRIVIENVVESKEDFAVRRVHMAAARLRETIGPFRRWQLVKEAGLHYHLEQNARVKNAIDLEMRPYVPVVKPSKS